MSNLGKIQSTACLFLMCVCCVLSSASHPAVASPTQKPTAPTSQEKQIDWQVAKGRVVDADGNPVADAQIFHNNHDRFPENTTKTDANGHFELKYQASPYFLSAGWIWAYSPNHNVRCVMLQPARKDTHLLKLPALSETEYQVVDPGGNPREAEVVPYRYATPYGIYSSDENTGLEGYVPQILRDRLCAKSNEDGTVKLRGMCAELLTSVNVKTPEFGQQITRPIHSFLELVEVGSVTVRVLPDEPIDFVGTTVTVASSYRDGEVVVSSNLSGTIDEKGDCVFEKVPRGEIDVYIKIDESRPFRPQPPPRTALEPGQGLLVEVPVKRTVHLFGKVLAGNQPVPNARISTGRGLDQAITDKDGNFDVHVFPGGVRLQVFSIPFDVQKDYYYPVANIINVPKDQKKITLDPVKLRLRESVTARVLDENGVPVTGYLFISTSGGRSRVMEAELNTDGEFSAKPRWQDWSTQPSSFKFFLAPLNDEARQDRSNWTPIGIKQVQPLVFEVYRETLRN